MSSSKRYLWGVRQCDKTHIGTLMAMPFLCDGSMHVCMHEITNKLEKRGRGGDRRRVVGWENQRLTYGGTEGNEY